MVLDYDESIDPIQSIMEKEIETLEKKLKNYSKFSQKIKNIKEYLSIYFKYVHEKYDLKKYNYNITHKSMYFGKN